LKCTKRPKEHNESKNEKKHKGKLIFYGKNCLHGSENEKTRLFKEILRRNRNQGKKKVKGMKQEKRIKKDEQ